MFIRSWHTAIVLHLSMSVKAQIHNLLPAKTIATVDVTSDGEDGRILTLKLGEEVELPLGAPNEKPKPVLSVSEMSLTSKDPDFFEEDMQPVPVKSHERSNGDLNTSTGSTGGRALITGRLNLQIPSPIPHQTLPHDQSESDDENQVNSQHGSAHNDHSSQPANQPATGGRVLESTPIALTVLTNSIHYASESEAASESTQSFEEEEDGREEQPHSYDSLPSKQSERNLTANRTHSDVDEIESRAKRRAPTKRNKGKTSKSTIPNHLDCSTLSDQAKMSQSFDFPESPSKDTEAKSAKPSRKRKMKASRAKKTPRTTPVGGIKSKTRYTPLALKRISHKKSKSEPSKQNLSFRGKENEACKETPQFDEIHNTEVDLAAFTKRFNFDDIAAEDPPEEEAQPAYQVRADGVSCTVHSFRHSCFGLHMCRWPKRDVLSCIKW